MTPCESPPETLAITGRIRDEIDARDMAATVVMSLLGMPSATWYRRMKHPGGWTIDELDKLAGILRVSRSRLTG